MAFHPFQPFLDHSGVAIIDGGLATQLEEDGFDLRHPLWSAHLLASNSAAIRAAHVKYLEAGADILITATYQATLQGLMAYGRSGLEAERLLQLAVKLATEARALFLTAHPERIFPLVAASIGPYGAYLADGSEYDGRYGLSLAELVAFHQPRWSILQDSVADILACETIPSYAEVEALGQLLSTGKPGWLSVVCKDSAHLYDGTPIEEAAQVIESCPNMVAFGINCTAPHHVTPLMERVRKAGSTLPMVVYPNSGDIYDPDTRQWRETIKNGRTELASLAAEWKSLGAVAIGGCCRTLPSDICRLRKALDDSQRG